MDKPINPFLQCLRFGRMFKALKAFMFSVMLNLEAFGK